MKSSLADHREAIAQAVTLLCVHDIEGAEALLVRALVDDVAGMAEASHGAVELPQAPGEYHVKASLGPGTYASIQDALTREQVVSVKKDADGYFVVKEQCDRVYWVALTYEQLLAWTDELKALTES